MSEENSPAPPIRLGIAEEDATAGEKSLPEKQWERLSDQRDSMIRAMITMFKWLNGAVVVLILIVWIVGAFFIKDYRLITENTIMTLIGATVVQAGAALLIITRFLFPTKEGQGQATS